MVRFGIISLAAVLCAFAAVRGLSTFAAGSPPPAHVAVATSPVEAQPTDDASIPKSPDGHYWADAEVNGQPIHFLIDTGATAVALTANDARRLGFNPASLPYAYTVSTANGQARAARVKLNMVAVGRAQVVDVDAFVIEKGLPTSLLGMTYLGRLSKFEATQSALNLRA
ncbi:MAG: TIGR02281 family clan AA aspartic protease [Caulobacteraceae bacterium]|nr:TIGR02281 family clan AA aspartic protease [Caulobacteraceae bacterium]